MNVYCIQKYGKEYGMKGSKLKILLAAAVLVSVFALIGFSKLEADAGDSVAGRTYACVKYEVEGKEQDPGAMKDRQLIFADDGTYVLTGYTDPETKETVANEKGVFTEYGSTITLKYTIKNGKDGGTLELEADYIKDGDILVFSGDYSKSDKMVNGAYELENHATTYQLVEPQE